MYDELWYRGLRDPNLALNRANARDSPAICPAPWCARRRTGSRPMESAAASRAWKMHDRRLPTRCTASRRSVSPHADHDHRHANVSFRGRLIAAVCWLMVCGSLVRFATNRVAWWLAFAGVWLAALAFIAGGLVDSGRAGSCPRDRIPARRAGERCLPAAKEFRLTHRGSMARPDCPKESRPRVSCCGGWIQIQLSRGVIGWIPEASAWLANAR